MTRLERIYDTTAAHTLMRHAAPDGPQRALADSLFAAYFLEAPNIASPDVLVDVATRHGFTAAAAGRIVRDDDELTRTRREVAAAAARGIRGVPLFIIDGSYPLVGAQSPEAFRQAIAQAHDREAV